MGNIPNTNTANLVLQSVGNGSNDSRWGTSGGGSTLPTGTGTGQMIWWNGTSWVVTTTPATNKYFYWNGSAWVGGTAGDATSIQGYPVNVTGLGNGDLLYWSNVGSTNQWLTGPTPTITGQYYSWNAGIGGWSLATSSGGGVTNTAWSSESNSLSLSSTLASWGSVTVTGFSNYTVTLSSTMSGNTTTARLQQQVYQSGTGLVGPLIGVNPGTTSTTYVMNVVQHLITGLSSSTSYTFYGYAAVTSGTGSVINGTIMAIGIS